MAIGLEMSRLLLNLWLAYLIGKNSSTYK